MSLGTGCVELEWFHAVGQSLTAGWVLARDPPVSCPEWLVFGPGRTPASIDAVPSSGGGDGRRAIRKCPIRRGMEPWELLRSALRAWHGDALRSVFPGTEDGVASGIQTAGQAVVLQGLASQDWLLR